MAKNKRTLPVEQRERLRDLATQRGERRVCQEIPLAPQTFARAAAGLPILAGSEALLRAYLNEDDA